MIMIWTQCGDRSWAIIKSSTRFPVTPTNDPWEENGVAIPFYASRAVGNTWCLPVIQTTQTPTLLKLSHKPLIYFIFARWGSGEFPSCSAAMPCPCPPTNDRPLPANETLPTEACRPGRSAPTLIHPKLLYRACKSRIAHWPVYHWDPSRASSWIRPTVIRCCALARDRADPSLRLDGRATRGWKKNGVDW